MSKNKTGDSGLTFDAELQGLAGSVALYVGGGAGEGPAHLLLDLLEDEGSVADQDPGREVLGDSRVLKEAIY